MTALTSTLSLCDFDYDLPPGQIAQAPPVRRDGGRLLVLSPGDVSLEDREVVDLPELLPPGALVIVNDSRVLPARLGARRPTGGKAEVLLLERLSPGRWRAMLGASKTLKAAEVLTLLDAAGEAVGAVTVATAPVAGRCEVTLDEALIPQVGAMPLPPYIRRPTNPADAERYQTVFAAEEGSVAAPTAGLHFSESLLSAITARGIELCQVTLHVGPGTFVPVRCEDPAQHQMESERYEVPAATAAAIARAREAGRAIVAVGTTVVRTLEASKGGAGAGRAELFIRPGYRFRVVDALLTNFHLPRSTLLMLVCALAGRERVLAAYRHAVGAGYRFYSYGDALLIR